MSNKYIHDLVKGSGGQDTHSTLLTHDAASIVCPICIETYVQHDGIVQLIAGNDAYAAAPNMVRGDVIAIPMRCEQGHKFLLCVGTHKGQTKTWCEQYVGELELRSPGK